MNKGKKSQKKKSPLSSLPLSPLFYFIYKEVYFYLFLYYFVFVFIFFFVAQSPVTDFLTRARSPWVSYNISRAPHSSLSHTTNKVTASYYFRRFSFSFSGFFALPYILSSIYHLSLSLSFFLSTFSTASSLIINKHFIPYIAYILHTSPALYYVFNDLAGWRLGIAGSGILYNSFFPLFFIFFFFFFPCLSFLCLVLFVGLSVCLAFLMLLLL